MSYIINIKLINFTSGTLQQLWRGKKIWFGETVSSGWASLLSALTRVGRINILWISLMPTHATARWSLNTWRTEPRKRDRYALGDSSLLSPVLWWFFREMSERTLCQMLRRWQFKQVSTFSSHCSSRLAFLTQTGSRMPAKLATNVSLDPADIGCNCGLSGTFWDKNALLEAKLCKWRQSS